jgi:hypothetical protein
MTAIPLEDLEFFFKDESEAVSFVAGLLNISEFRLFEIAYENWFGIKAPQKTINELFKNYLESGLVPYWLRNMVRKSLCEYRKGNLTPSSFGIEHPHETRSRRKLGWILLGFFYLLILVIIWGSANYGSTW